MTQFEQKEAAIQPGMVLVWSGDPTNIPAGWGVCDGQNGTPDFRDRLPKGVSNVAKQPGSIGGQNSYTISETQMPAHNHSATVQNTGDHYHTRSSGYAYTSSPSYVNIGDGTGNGLTTGYNGDHSHTITTAYTGSGNSVDSLPSHNEAHYIMRL